MRAYVTSVELPEGRTVRVGLADTNTAVISIERPIEDNQLMPRFAFRDEGTHYLRFQMSRGAAEALYAALGSQLGLAFDVSLTRDKDMDIKMPWQHPIDPVSTTKWYKLGDDGVWEVEMSTG